MDEAQLRALINFGMDSIVSLRSEEKDEEQIGREFDQMRKDVARASKGWRES